MKRTQYLLLIAVVCTTLQSCTIDLYKQEEPDKAFTQFTVSLFEKFEQGNRLLALNLETIEDFPCSNFLINTYVFYTETELQVEVKNLIAPDSCILMLGPATRTIVLQNYKLYSKPIKIVFDNHYTKLTYELTDKYIIWRSIGGSINNAILVSNDTLNRIPDNFVWGYFVTDSKTGAEITDELLRGFKDAGAMEYQLTDGNYHFFKVEGGTLRFASQNVQLNSLGFKFTGEIEQLIDIAKRVVPGVKIKFYDTRGNIESSNQ